MTGFFITGTDTGIGKTYSTVLLARQLIGQGYRVAALKPVASGADRINGQLRNADALQLQVVSNVELSYTETNPYCFMPPIPPHIAASQQHVAIDSAVIAKQVLQAQARADAVLVEGVGGWLAPLTSNATVADLARQLHLPVLLVVGLRLGCLNHALLSAAAIANSSCELAGWLANVIDPNYAVADETITYLRTHIPSPCVGVISYQSTEIAQLDARQFNEILARQKT
jgi:dethiobiotin synthetase